MQKKKKEKWKSLHVFDSTMCKKKKNEKIICIR